MLDGTDKETFHSLRLLKHTVEAGNRPIILWIGAGASQWQGYPGWKETAERFHSEYLRFEPNYDARTGQHELDSANYPQVFERCRRLSFTRYNALLAKTFGPRPLGPVYRHFLDVITRITPLFILTTNVDESLERNLPQIATIQRSDLERCESLLDEKTAFAAKIHGSVGSIESVIFTESDYAKLTSDETYTAILRNLFARASVAFVGYGLRDHYVLDMLEKNIGLRRLFGDGPHFAVQGTDLPHLPQNVHPIRYVPEPHTDHRSAIVILDVIRTVKEGPNVTFPHTDTASSTSRQFVSGYFLTDVIPPGTWTSSQTLTLGGGDQPRCAIVGQGFVDSELPERVSPALHDLVVGLISFDTVWAPLSSAPKLHDFLGPDFFWQLVAGGILRFLYFENEPGLLFASPDAVSGGDIGSVGLAGRSSKFLSVEEEIARIFRAIPGKEAEAARLFSKLREQTVTFDDERFAVPSLTRGALLHPAVQILLGLSDAVLPTSIPRWLAFPVIRLAHTIQAGCACEGLSLAATKIAFGGEVLAGAAFALAAAHDWADSVASYVLSSQFNTELGAYAAANPAVFGAILRLRESNAGIELRREILQELTVNDGTEFVASVDAGLRKIVPTSVMDAARNRLSGLLLPRSAGTGVVPAVWTRIRNADISTKLWRARSKEMLEEYCSGLRIREYDPCPCNSGERLRFCCARALRE